MIICESHYLGCWCREAKLKALIEAAIQNLGVPRMTYEPKVEIKELRNIVKGVSRSLLKGLKENFK